LIYPDTDPKSFSLKHNVAIIEERCINCGMLVEVNIPITSKDFVGFQSKEHECGPNYIISYLKDRKNRLD
jgi:hypothetical protein